MTAVVDEMSESAPGVLVLAELLQAACNAAQATLHFALVPIEQLTKLRRRADAASRHAARRHRVVLCAGAPDTPEIGREMQERVAAVSEDEVADGDVGELQGEIRTRPGHDDDEAGIQR